jgi:hypothetical protein
VLKLVAFSCASVFLFNGASHAATNVAPKISGTPATSVQIRSWYKFVPAASDADGGPKALRYSIVNKPAWASFSIYSGTLSGASTSSGTWSGIRISVTDGAATASLPAFAITAGTTSNRAPLISGTPASTVDVGSTYAFRPTASDADGDALSYSIQNRPTWASFSSSTGQLSGIPASTHVASYSNIVIGVSDGKVTTLLPAFSITVRSSGNAAPVISGTPAANIAINSWYKFVPSASDPDKAPRALRYSIVNKPAWASFSIYSGTLSGASKSSGTWSGIRISVTDGAATASLPAFAITAGGSTTTSNRAPVISGAPATSVNVGSVYSFLPTATDPDGNALGFSIQNRPAWATFNTATGKLSGTPTSSQAASYSSIIIGVSDGKASVALPAFAIEVTNADAPGTATISWVAPTLRADETPLVNLAGYRIHYGTDVNALYNTVHVGNPGLTSYVVQNLAAGTYYFSVTAFDSVGTISELSNKMTIAVR